MSNYVKNAVKLLSKIDSVDNYVVLYTEFDGFFEKGDRLYIMSTDTSSDEYQYLDSINNTGTTSNTMGYILLEKIGNYLKIDKHYSDFPLTGITSECYIGKVYIRNSIIKRGTINASMLHNIELDINPEFKLTWKQGVLSSLSGDTIDNVIFQKKYDSDFLIYKTEINNNTVESYYTYNNYDDGLTIINLSNNRFNVYGSDIYDGIYNKCDFYTSTIISNFPSSDDLIGHWSFNDGTGKINQGTSNQDAIIYSGNIIIDGISNKALSRKGTGFDNGISVIPNINLNYDDDFSISVWFKLDSDYQGDIGITYSTSVFLKYNSNSIHGIDILNPHNNPSIRFGIVQGNNMKTSIATISYDRWYHCVFINNNGQYIAYLNKELIGSSNTAIEFTGNGDYLIGYRSGLNGQFLSFRGSIDEPRIYNKILTLDEIIALYENPGGDLSLKRYIYSGRLNDCSVGNGYIINGGKLIESTIDENCEWQNGRWYNSYTGITDNPFGCDIWQDGTWINGTFPNVTWQNGRFLNGKFVGEWQNGRFLNGIFEDSIWYGGSFNGGIFNDSTWIGGEFNNGEFNNSTWSGGTFNNGTMNNSTWSGGTFNNGIINTSEWLDGTFNNGEFNQSTWYNGSFNGGQFNESVWYNGTFHGGQLIDSIWYNGKFYYGSVFDSIWYNGEMYYGIINELMWSGGTWYDGIVNDITWYDGNWYDGVFNFGYFYKGNWYNGSFNGGYFGTRDEDNEIVEPMPIWYDGTFYFGQFNGIWSGGTFYTGDLKDGENLIPSQYYIGTPYIQYNKKSIVNKYKMSEKLPKLKRF